MTQTFLPPRRAGLIFQITTTVLLSLGSGYFLQKANNTEIGVDFLLFILLFAVLGIPIPVLVYRTYSLLRGHYTLSPDGIKLRWGFRSADIPIYDITWVAARNTMQSPLPIPVLRWPGALAGTRTQEAYEIEYMAANTAGLIYLSTKDRIFGITPVEADAFLSAYHRISEMGSLNPLTPRSIYPALLLQSVWSERPARVLLVSGLVLSLGFLLLVTFLFSFDPDTLSLPLTAAQLALLPVLNGAFFTVDFFIGLFMFRRDETRMLGYLLWGSSVFTSLLFLFVVIFAFRG